MFSILLRTSVRVAKVIHQMAVRLETQIPNPNFTEETGEKVKNKIYKSFVYIY